MPNDTDHLHLYARRLAADPEPGCWFGFVVRAIPAAPRRIDGVTIQAPEHYLTAAWQPVEGLLPRLPDVVAIGSPTATRALAELFANLPKHARLHLVERDVVDAALLAEIVALADGNLLPYQREGLYKFAEQERARVRSEISRHFSDRDEGFEQFKAKVTGTKPVA
jgi:hypothetical protein